VLHAGAEPITWVSLTGELQRDWGRLATVQGIVEVVITNESARIELMQTRTTELRMKVLLALILTGQFMAVLDASIVNVAIPTIRLDLRASGSDLQLMSRAMSSPTRFC
jgi:hypothetical protein